MANPTRHVHECACGDFFVCSQEPDHCPIRTWDCPACEADAMDAYFQQLSHSDPNPTQQEMTFYEKH